MQLETVTAEVAALKIAVQYQLDIIVSEMNRQSFGGSKQVVLKAVNEVAAEMDLPLYEWAVNVQTGQSERVGGYVVSGEPRL